MNVTTSVPDPDIELEELDELDELLELEAFDELDEPEGAASEPFPPQAVTSRAAADSAAAKARPLDMNRTPWSGRLSDKAQGLQIEPVAYTSLQRATIPQSSVISGDCGDQPLIARAALTLSTFEAPKGNQPMSRKIVAHLSKVDPVMRDLIGAAGPYRPRVQADCPPFQVLAQAIAHQQLNGIAANTILTRFITSCGEGSFPTPEAVLAASEAQLRATGLSFAKIASLRDLASKTLSGTVPTGEVLVTLDAEDIVERLTQVRGIGRWTVEMMLMFHLHRPDVLPVDDFGVRNGFRLAYGLRKLPAPRALRLYGERWGPHRTAAAWYLWRAVELAKVGQLPAPPERFRLPRVPRTHRRSTAVARRTTR